MMDASASTTEEPFTIETVVLGPFRLWHIVGLGILVISIGVIVVCCLVDCRIPRSRQAIERSHKKREIYNKYGQKLTSETNHPVELKIQGPTNIQKQKTTADSGLSNTSVIVDGDETGNGQQATCNDTNSAIPGPSRSLMSKKTTHNRVSSTISHIT